MNRYYAKILLRADAIAPLNSVFRSILGGFFNVRFKQHGPLNGSVNVSSSIYILEAQIGLSGL